MPAAYVLADDAEALVERVYERVQLPASWMERVTAGLGSLQRQ
jgi:hypothetical protein